MLTKGLSKQNGACRLGFRLNKVTAYKINQENTNPTEYFGTFLQNFDISPFIMSVIRKWIARLLHKDHVVREELEIIETIDSFEQNVE